MINLKQLQAQADATLAIVNDAKAVNADRKEATNVFAWYCLQLMFQANVRDLVTIGRMVAKGATHNALKQYVSRAKALSAFDVITFTSGTGKKAAENKFTKAQILASDTPLFSVATVYAKLRAQTETTASEISDDDIVKQQISVVEGLTIDSLSDTEYADYLAEGKLEIAEQEKAAMLENIPSLEKEIEQKLNLLKSVSPDTFDAIAEKFFAVKAPAPAKAPKQVNAH